MTRVFLGAAMLALLAGCGSVTRLRPTKDMTAVPKAAAADRIETAAELMTPSTQAQPDRQADLLSKSTARKDDPFALPPGAKSGQPAFRSGGAATTTVPQPANTAQDRNETGQGLPETINANDDRPDDPEAPVPAPAQTTP